MRLTIFLFAGSRDVIESAGARLRIGAYPLLGFILVSETQFEHLKSYTYVQNFVESYKPFVMTKFRAVCTSGPNVFGGLSLEKLCWQNESRRSKDKRQNRSIIHDTNLNQILTCSLSTASEGLCTAVVDWARENDIFYSLFPGTKRIDFKTVHF